MKCEFCSKPVFGKEGITVIGLGASHVECFEIERTTRRVFAGVSLNELDERGLTNLYEMVMTEMNARSEKYQDSSVEFF
ncbi:MAG: DUF2175 domain-containing protein [Gammaproteobacteria bacterium]|nr:DUF2175 domain-containing protein [Gammaproteobacteria bacterium]